jgi:hypothetical protein
VPVRNGAQEAVKNAVIGKKYGNDAADVPIILGEEDCD